MNLFIVRLFLIHNFYSINYIILVVNFMLFTSAIFLLLSNATTARRDLALMFNRCLMTIFAISLIISINSNNYLLLKEGVSLFSGLFHNTNLTMTFHAFLIIVSIMIVQLTAFLPRYYISNVTSKRIRSLIYSIQLSDKAKEQYTIIEYPLILLFIIIGAVLLINSSDVISIFLSIELQSYGLYLLCALYRNSESSTGAGLTYFLLGGLSSCFILLALGILYTNSGTTSLNGYYMLANIDLNDTTNNLLYWYDNNYLNYSLVILSVGFLFKISAAPFHFWSPDVYDAIPTVVTTFVANIAKISILIFLVEIVHYTDSLVISNFNWTNSLLLSSLLSLIIGTVLGLNQSRIKKLLAYSTISHLGFMLLAISVDSIESMQAFIFYLMQYSISNVNAFIIVISIGYTMFMYNRKEKEDKTLLDEENSPIQYIAQLKGYFYINPILAVSFVIVIYSFVGIPPLVGFFGKQMVLSAALDKGYIFISLIAILTSVISAVYYLNIVKEMFFNKSDYRLITLEISKKNQRGDRLSSLSSNLAVTISVLTLIMLLFMISPEQWLSISNILAILLFS